MQKSKKKKGPIKPFSQIDTERSIAADRFVLHGENCSQFSRDRSREISKEVPAINCSEIRLTGFGFCLIVEEGLSHAVLTPTRL
jgi:hypothetical protein